MYTTSQYCYYLHQAKFQEALTSNWGNNKDGKLWTSMDISNILVDFSRKVAFITLNRGLKQKKREPGIWGRSPKHKLMVFI